MCQLSRNSRCILTSPSLFLRMTTGRTSPLLHTQIPPQEITYLLCEGGNRCCASLCVCSACLMRRPREFNGYVWALCWAAESEHHAARTRVRQENAHNTGDKAEERIFNSVWASEVIHSHSRDTQCVCPPPASLTLTHTHSHTKSHYATGKGFVWEISLVFKKNSV